MQYAAACDAFLVSIALASERLAGGRSECLGLSDARSPQWPLQSAARLCAAYYVDVVRLTRDREE